MLVESTRLPTLLVVDDDPAILELMDRFATELGFTVVQERNGRAALASLPRTRPDGAIVDVAIAGHRRPEQCCVRSRPPIRSRR